MAEYLFLVNYPFQMFYNSIIHGQSPVNGKLYLIIVLFVKVSGFYFLLLSYFIFK